MLSSNGSVLDQTYVAADGTNLTAFGWVDDGVTPVTVLNNRLIADGASDVAPSIYGFPTSPPTTTFAVEVGIHFITTSTDSLSFFALDMLGQGYAFKWDSASGQWVFATNNGGTNIIAAAADTPSTGVTVQYIYRRDDDRHRHYVDGVLLIDVIDDTYDGDSIPQIITSADINATQGGHFEYLRIGAWVIPQGEALLAGVGDPSAEGARTSLGNGGLTTVGGLTGEGSRDSGGIGTSSGVGGLIGEGSRPSSGEGTATAPGELSSVGARVSAGASSLVGTGEPGAEGARDSDAEGVMSGVGSLTGEAAGAPRGLTVLTGAGALAGSGARGSVGSGELSGIGALLGHSPQDVVLSSAFFRSVGSETWGELTEGQGAFPGSEGTGSMAPGSDDTGSVGG